MVHMIQRPAAIHSSEKVRTTRSPKNLLITLAKILPKRVNPRDIAEE